MNVSLSFFQYTVLLGNIEVNLQKVEKIKNRIPKGGLFVLPEMFCCGFDYENLPRLAKKSNLVLDFLKELSLQRESVVIATLPIEEEGKVFNTAVVFDNGKFLCKRRKIALFPLFKETKYFSPGREEENIVFQTSVGKIGIVICFEIRINRFTNKLRRQGVEIIVVPAMWPIQRREHFKILTHARAIETQSFLVAANGWGKDPKDQTFFGGASGIYGPWGETLAYTADGETISSVEVDLREVQKVRKKLPVEL